MDELFSYDTRLDCIYTIQRIGKVAYPESLALHDMDDRRGGVLRNGELAFFLPRFG